MAQTLEGFRLSPQQERVWHLQQADRRDVYIAACAVLIKGSLKHGALKQAIRQVVERHEILRTNFRFVPELGIPVQTIGGEPFDWDCDVVAGNYDTLDSAFEEWRTQAPAQIQTSPLRLRLVNVDRLGRLLLISLPALCADSISVSNLVQEISKSYRAVVEGIERSCMPLQYADVAEWQLQLPDSTEHQAGVEHWSRVAASRQPVGKLLFRKGSSTDDTFAPALFSICLDRELCHRVRKVAALRHTSRPIFLLACWQVLVAKLTGQNSVVVSTRFDGRNLQELKSAIGLFEKYLPISIDISDAMPFSALLKEVERSAAEASLWQDYFRCDRFESGDESSYGPVAFEYRLERSFYDAGDVGFSIQKRSVYTDRFAIKLSCIRRNEGLTFEFHYDSNLFCEEEMALLAERLSVLIRSACLSPDSRIDNLSVLGPRERRQILDLNRTEQPYDRRRNIHDLFREQAARTPDAIAVVSGWESLSYRELNRRSDRLVVRLREVGVGPEVLTAVCLERSPALIVALLGVLKAGGAYVPLDPGYPIDRLDFMIRDSAAAVIVTGSELVSALPQNTATLVLVDSSKSVSGGDEQAPEPVSTAAENLAYVIYTSGSTGIPKGVAIQHSSAVALLEWTRQAFTADDLAVVLASTSICFDLSVFELFATLSVGGRVVLCENLLDVPKLNEVQQVTLINTVPSVISALMRTAKLPRSVRTVNLAGEALKQYLVRQVYEAGQIKSVNNLYGPSEDTTYSTWTLVEKEIPDEPAIGRPITNTQVHVLDRHFGLLPIGVAGELYISGDGLARCYLNNPEATAERFLPDPFGGTGGGRMYRTGDLGRCMLDGNLDYLGRLDHQVKIRGYRIELGEIEATLLQHPSVREAAVAAVEDPSGDKQLAAYVVSASEGPLRRDELRAYLETRLPRYMLPTWIGEIASLPLTANGKLDRRALPPPDRESILSRAPREQSRTATEELLGGIVAEVLNLDVVHPKDNFFDVGGHSLLATQVISRVRELFGIELGLKKLFEAPTVAGLAAAIDEAVHTRTAFDRPALLRRERPAEIPLSYAQQRLWFLDQLSPGTSAYNIASAVKITGKLKYGAFLDAVSEVFRRHEALRTVFRVVGEEPVQVVRHHDRCIVPVIDICSLPEKSRESEAAVLAAESASEPFDLAQGPLARITLVNASEDAQLVLMCMHHIVSDGWSLELLLQELINLYAAYAEGRPSPLGDLTIQYPDYATWQRDWLSGDALGRQLSYWKTHLADSPAVLELPTDRPRPAVQTYKGRSERIALSSDLAEGVFRLSRQYGVTLYMTLLAAFDVLLHRYSHQDDISVGTPIAGRNRLETEPLIGFFVNTLVIRTRGLSQGPTFSLLLGYIRDVVLEAYVNQDLPFEMLVEEIQPQRSLSHSPIVQVLFALNNLGGNSDLGAESTGLTFEPFEITSGAAKFDLSLFVSETNRQLSAEIEYNTDLFDVETVKRMLGHFEVLLKGVVSNSDQPLPSINLLTESEQRQLVTWWNEAARDCPVNGCIHQLFERQAARAPDAIALVSRDARLSYRELNIRANKLARYLRALGVMRDTPVAVCCDRGLDLVIGLLGILKAGGAYVPLDPNYPEERCSFILEDSGAKILLTQDELYARLAPKVDCAVRLDSDWNAISQEGDSDIDEDVDGQNLAYIIFTSGSTGRPKGVAIEHHSTVTLLHWAREFFEQSDLSGVLASTSICFDLSVFELFAPLSWGGTVIISTNALELGELDAAGEVTLINSVPSAMEELLRLHSLPASVRVVNLAGEPLAARLAQDVWRCPDVTKLLNLYGPSEDTTYSTCAVIAKASTSQPSIGRAISNKRVYLLDSHLKPVPVGVYGEVYIAGDGVARGYIHRPELTGERFLPDLMSEIVGSRMYRTGDLARYRPDGEIEFLGRIDHQVKLRGFRIELGEIESVLAAHDSIRDVVVAAREGRNGQKRLVAYMVSDGVVPAPSELKAMLAQKLPDYMIPTEFVTIESLPRTPNGKVDRGSLPEPDPAAKVKSVARPRDVLELRLARIWEQVLGVDQIGIEDDFFDLGGHSLLAVRLISAVNRELAQSLPLTAMFQATTIEAMARLLRAGEVPQYGVLVPVHSGGESAPFFCVHAAGGNALALVDLARHLGNEVPFYAFQSPLLADGSNSGGITIEDLAGEYIGALRLVQSEGPYTIGGWSMGGVVAFEMARQLCATGERVALLALIDTVAPAPNGNRHNTNPLELVAGLALEMGITPEMLGDSEQIGQIEPDRQLDVLLERARTRGLVPSEIDISFASRLLTVYAANVDAAARYQPHPINFKPTLFIASDRPSDVSADPTLGWSAYCPEGVQVHSIPGDHFNIVREPGVRVLAEMLKCRLARPDMADC